MNDAWNRTSSIWEPLKLDQNDNQFWKKEERVKQRGGLLLTSITLLWLTVNCLVNHGGDPKGRCISYGRMLTAGGKRQW